MLQIATNGQVILASTTSSLYRSVDGGASWSRIPSGQLFGLVTIGQDFVSIGVHGGYFSVRRSTDGITWTTLRQGNGKDHVERKLYYPLEGTNCFTSREVEVLRELHRGLTSKQIAEHLAISELTVSKHRMNMMKKANVANARSLINYALQNQLL